MRWSAGEERENEEERVKGVKEKETIVVKRQIKETRAI